MTVLRFIAWLLLCVFAVAIIAGLHQLLTYGVAL